MEHTKEISWLRILTGSVPNPGFVKVPFSEIYKHAKVFFTGNNGLVFDIKHFNLPYLLEYSLLLDRGILIRWEDASPDERLASQLRQRRYYLWEKFFTTRFGKWYWKYFYPNLICQKCDNVAYGPRELELMAISSRDVSQPVPECPDCIFSKLFLGQIEHMAINNIYECEDARYYAEIEGPIYGSNKGQGIHQ